MTSLLESIVKGGNGVDQDPKFPYAPEGWTSKLALKAAQDEGLIFREEHWEAVRALQEYFAKHKDGVINLRELHDALDEKFHAQGGIKHLYLLFPGGPVAQGCRLAGLKPPPGAEDKSFGSVA
jgi:TusE/DsrC/DsvC family sulfur relay protein